MSTSCGAYRLDLAEESGPDLLAALADLGEVARERDAALAQVADLLPRLAARHARELFLNSTIAQLRADLAQAQARLHGSLPLVGA